MSPTLLARSRHRSIRSLERYTLVGRDALARHVAKSDPTHARTPAADHKLAAPDDRRHPVGIYWVYQWVFSGYRWCTGCMTAPQLPTADDLRPFLRRGLPAAGDTVTDHLLDLPGVRARAATHDRDSRVAAFNTLLRQLLSRLPDQQTATAAHILFGTATTDANANLMSRRVVAAAMLGRDPDHFRKNIEPRILADIAEALIADSDRMAVTSSTAPRLVPVLHPPAALPADMWAWETAEHEEHMSRLWAAVYALRAELLACERLASMNPDSTELRDAAEAALWRFGQLHLAIRTYRRAYGATILHGDIPPETLIDLAGWTPPLSLDDIDVIGHCGPNAERFRTYLTTLTAAPTGADIIARWVTALAEPRASTGSTA